MLKKIRKKSYPLVKRASVVCLYVWESWEFRKNIPEFRICLDPEIPWDSCPGKSRTRPFTPHLSHRNSPGSLLNLQKIWKKYWRTKVKQTIIPYFRSVILYSSLSIVCGVCSSDPGRGQVPTIKTWQSWNV